MKNAENELKEFTDLKAKDPSSLFNRLFFAARNGAIAYLLLRIEAYFRENGFSVKADWKESSFGGPIVTVTMLDKKTGEHERNIFVNRNVVGRDVDTHSSCVYSLKSVAAGAYYRSKKPVVAEKFDEVLGSEEFKGKVEKWILGTNYPFDYKSYSAF